MAITTSQRSSEEVSRLIHDAKEPVTAVAGPYGHPFHPILVTIPIGAWVASLLFDIASRVSGDGNAALVEGSYWLIGLGVVGALLAAVFGLVDLLGIPRRTRAFRFGLIHLCLNLVIVASFVANFAWRHDSYDTSVRVGGGQLVLTAVAIGLLLVSGWIGGMLAYRYGVRVADEADQADGYR